MLFERKHYLNLLQNADGNGMMSACITASLLRVSTTFCWANKIFRNKMNVLRSHLTEEKFFTCKIK